MVSEVMTRDVATFDGESSVEGALERYFGASQRHRAYPALIGATVIGMVDRGLLVAGMKRAKVVRVADLFGAQAPAVALPGENCRAVAHRLAVHRLERLPVVADVHSRRLLGVISRATSSSPLWRMPLTSNTGSVSCRCRWRQPQPASEP